MKEKIRTFKSVFIITAFANFGFIFSLLLQILLAYFFGAKREMDAYFLALSLPLLISGIITSTARVIFVPNFKNFIVKKDEDSMWRMISVITNYLFLILSALVAVLFLLAPAIISIMATGFSTPTRELAVSLLRILSFSVFSMGLSSLLVSIYYSKESFTKPSFVQALNIICVLLFVIIFNSLLGIRSLAYGFVFASVIQCVLLLSFLAKEIRRKFKPSFSAPGVGMNQIWRRAFIVIVGTFIFGLIYPLEKLLASNLSEGSISYLGYADKIFCILLLLPNMALPVVLFPQQSGHFATYNISRLRSTFSAGIRSTLFITLPLVVTLFIFRRPIIYLLLQRGAFDQQATLSTAVVLACYLGVFFESERLVILNTLYAIRDVITPFIVGIISFIFYFLIAVPLSKRMSFSGLALAHSAAFLFYSTLNITVLKFRLRYIDGSRICLSAMKIAVSSICAGSIMWMTYKSLNSFIYLNSFASILSSLLISILIGIISYTGFCYLMRLEEMKQFYKIIIVTKERIFSKRALGEVTKRRQL